MTIDSVNSCQGASALELLERCHTDHAKAKYGSSSRLRPIASLPSGRLPKIAGPTPKYPEATSAKLPAGQYASWPQPPASQPPSATEADNARKTTPVRNVSGMACLDGGQILGSVLSNLPPLAAAGPGVEVRSLPGAAETPWPRVVRDPGPRTALDLKAGGVGNRWPRGFSLPVIGTHASSTCVRPT